MGGKISDEAQATGNSENPDLQNLSNLSYADVARLTNPEQFYNKNGEPYTGVGTPYKEFTVTDPNSEFFGLKKYLNEKQIREDMGKLNGSDSVFANNQRNELMSGFVSLNSCDGLCLSASFERARNGLTEHHKPAIARDVSHVIQPTNGM